MKRNKTIKEDIDLLDTLKSLCTSYEELSVIKMQKIRTFVLATRQFNVKLSDVYVNVKTSYQRQVSELMKKKHITDPKKFVRTVKNGRSVAVFISANTKLHGPIVEEIFKDFKTFIATGTSDIMIIGKLGRELYEKMSTSSVKKNYLYFEIPDMDINLEDLKSIVYHLLQYEHITVFYGQYDSMLKQVAQRSNITGDIVIQESTETQPNQFLFEPTLETILDFFETQIFSALFKQTVHESQLARFASRIQAMEYALNKIDHQQGALNIRQRRDFRNMENKNQLERLAGISLWGR